MNDLDNYIISYLKSTNKYKKNASEHGLKFVSDLDKKIFHIRTSGQKKESLKSIGDKFGVSKQAIHSRMQRLMNFFDNL